MKYLITGGAGFIGSEIANQLKDECIVIDNLSSGFKKNLNKEISFERGDILDEKFIDLIFSKYRPERIIHLAAQVSVPKSIIDPIKDAETNIKGTLNILNACVKYKCQKIVFASSVAVYGNADIFPLIETHPAKPVNPYGVSKLTTEYYAYYFYKHYGLKYIALRYSNVYGPKQNSNGEGGVIAIFMNNKFKKLPLTVFGTGKQTRDFIYVSDVADATIKAVSNNLTGIYNVSTNCESSINEIVSFLQKKGLIKSQIIHTGKRSGDIDRSWLSNDKIKKDFNWSPGFKLDQGLIRMIKESK